MVGVSHHQAPVALRERLAIAPQGFAEGKGSERAAESLTALVREEVGPAVALSTCNRLEVYCATRRPRARERLTRVLAAWSGVPRAQLAPVVYSHAGVAAAQHLIRVAAGLDSLAVGESEVLGQVRAAWLEARPVGPELETLFRRGIEAGRRIRKLGAFDRHPSVAGLAVEALTHTLGGLEGRHVGVLGAGITGRAALGALLGAGAQRVTLLNRSRHRLARLRADVTDERVELATLDALPAALVTVDALVCATSAPGAVVTEAAVAEAVQRRAGRPLGLVDIAVPRDVEPAVGGLTGVRLLNLDDLAAGCALDGRARGEALERADALAREEAAAVMAALERRTAATDIAALRAHAAAIRESELRRVTGRLSGLSAREKATVEQLTHAIVQKLLHPPTVALRRAAGGRIPAQRARTAIVRALTDPSTQRSTQRGTRRGT